MKRIQPQSSELDELLSKSIGEEEEKMVYCWKSDSESELYTKIKTFMETVNYNCIKETTKWFMETATLSFQLTVDDLMMIMTLFVLFADNFKLMYASKTIDDDFIVINAICLFAFIFELMLNTWSKTNFKLIRNRQGCRITYEGYLFTFFWILDVIAILSMLPDIPWIADPIGLGGISSSVSSTNKLSKVGRVLRLVRLVRLVKLYKITLERRKKAKQEEEMMRLVHDGVMKYEEVVKQREILSSKQSRLGEQLSESTTQRVVVLVLVMVCILPLLDVPEVNYGPEFSTKFLHEFNVDQTIHADAKTVVLDTFIKTNAVFHDENHLFKLKYLPSNNNLVVDKSTELSVLREPAIATFSYVTPVGGIDYITAATFGYKWLEVDNAMFSIVTTVFIAILLVVGSLIFTADTQTMVIAPIERMMNMVEAVARDPLKPLSFDHEHHDEASATGDYETRLLETTIEKITGLLRVGFGEAGAGIISANLQNAHGGSAAVNPLLPGVRIYAVIGFCDIHHFEEINNLLTNDVLIFVNTIAEIVHSRVHYWGGQCNKNLGNAFVILWRIGDELDVQLQSQGGSTKGSIKAVSSSRKGTSKVVDLRRVPGVDKLADHALVGYLKIIAEINRNTTILEYRREPRLTQNGTKKFKVSMGFGLHAGWAIEGAVGSIHKVDATYLSPHVNMAARLETSSRQYGVPLLISQNAYDLFSAETQKYCRKCDVVTVKGSEVPIGVFTYDALQDQMFPKTKIQKIDELDSQYIELCPEEEEAAERRIRKFHAMGIMPPIYDEDNSDEENDDTIYSGAMASIGSGEVTFCRNNIESSELFADDTDLKILRQHATDPEFLEIFKSGVDEYLEGNWSSAKIKLTNASNLMSKLAPALKGDGPCMTLLDYMEEFGPDAPSWWKGYRPLTAK